MKVLQSFRFLITALVISVIALAVSLTTFAEEEAPQDKITQLESQVKELMDFKQQVQNYNPNISPVGDFKDVDQEPQPLGGDGTKFPPDICIKGYQEWPSSDTYKENEWAMEDMVSPSNSMTNSFSDLNGDGLQDYYVYYTYDNSYKWSCVQLNNGRGWDIVHQCYMAKPGAQDPWTFYGDCAAQ